MAIDTLKIINDALRMIGSAPIGALDEDASLADQAVTVHELAIDAALELWDWRWCRRTVQLEALATTPIGYSNGYEWPAAAVGGPKALFVDPTIPDVRLRDFRAEGREIHCNSDVLYGVFPMRIDPASWPASFRIFYTTWLASRLGVPVGHDDKIAAYYAQEAIGTTSEGGRGGLLGRAIGMDASQSGGLAPLNATDTLTDAHWGGGADGWSGGGGW